MENQSKHYFYIIAQYTYEDINKKDNIERLGLVNGAVTGNKAQICRKEIEYFNTILLNKVMDRYANRKVKEFSMINIIPLGQQTDSEWNFEI